MNTGNIYIFVRYIHMDHCFYLFEWFWLMDLSYKSKINKKIPFSQYFFLCVIIFLLYPIM